MKPLLRGLAIVCVATVIAEGIGVGYLWSNGKIDPDKWFDVLAALYGVDMDEMRREAATNDAPPHDEQPAFEVIDDARFLASLNLDLRESAVEKATVDFQYLKEQLTSEYEQYQNLKLSFDKAWETTKGTATIPELREVMQTLQALSPKQAKEQLLQLLGYGPSGTLPADHDTQSVYDVVTIIKAMPLDKRKKIFAEFRSPQEIAQLGDILKLIRAGIPEMTLIRETREKLEQFNQRLAKG